MKVGLTEERGDRSLQQDKFGPLQEGATGRLTWVSWDKALSKAEVQKGLSQEEVSSLSSWADYASRQQRATIEGAHQAARSWAQDAWGPVDPKML